MVPGSARRITAAFAVVVAASAATLSAAALAGAATRPADDSWTIRVDSSDRPAPVILAPDPVSGPVARGAQTLVVTVNAGPLTVTPTAGVVALRRVGHSRRFEGSFGPISVVDSRGSLVGWRLTARLAPASAADGLRLRPTTPVAVTGRREEVQSGRAGPISTAAAVVLMDAPPGGGGGTFSVGGTVELADGSSGGPDSIVATVVFSAV